MYVRKFEADSLDEALKSIKRELGPDAIILKTVTNKGLKGAFKKNRIEITAAISEKNYTRKARVDQVLEDDHKDNFYNSSSSYISEMIDSHADNSADADRDRYEVKNNNYNNMALNKSVKTVKDLGDKVRNSLDDFLSGPQGQHLGQEPEQFELPENYNQNFYTENNSTPSRSQDTRQESEASSAVGYNAPSSRSSQTNEGIDSEVIVAQRKKIDELEKKLYELTRSVERIDKAEPHGIYQLRTTLRSLDINETTVNELIKKATFELSNTDVQDIDTVFEFALREMLERIPTAMPQFSNLRGEEESFITILVSDNSCGQTSMLYKLGTLQKESVLIQYQPGKDNTFTEQMFGLIVEKVNSTSEVVSAIRKANEAGQNVIVDYRNYKTEVNDTKKMIDGLRRSFGKVEVMICLSAIHSELYNKKVTATYEGISDGIVVTNLDLCLNYGALFNLCEEYPGLPLKFFGTGDVVPEDIEAATGERILAGMFKLK